MLQRIVLISCYVLLASAHAWGAADAWPQFRGPTGQGESSATNVPVEWSSTKNVAWKAPIAGRGWSSPVLAEGRLYLTNAIDGGDGLVTLHALCLNATDGSVVWDVAVLKPDAAAVHQMHDKNSPASSTPVVTADRLYVHFGTLGTAALDLSGKVLWRQMSLKYPPVHGNGGSPVLVGNELLFTCDGATSPYFAALSADTGEVKWKMPRNTPAHRTFSFSTPLAIALDGATQVICPTSGLVGAYDPADGHEIWRVRYGEGYSVVPRPVYSHGMIFVSSGFDSPTLYAIKPQGASGDVTKSHVAWTQRKGTPTTPSVIVVGDELYMVSDAGIASCLDVATGKQHWTHRLDGGFSASPVSAEGRVYFQNEAGVGYVIKAMKTFEQPAENDLGERSLASYAVADGALFIRTEKHLWRIGTGGK